MVKVTRLLFVAAFLSTSLSAKDLADYKIGERAESDITAPVPLVVINPAATAELKSKEGERVPVVFRFYPQAGEQVVAAFHQSFLQTRGSFLDAIEESFDSRMLDSNALASPKFAGLVVSFQKKNLLFPVTTDLARLWAGGEQDQEFESPLLWSLAAEMKNFIRATNAIPDGAKVGGTVRVVSCGETETLTAQMVARHGTNYPKTAFVSFPRAKADLQSAFPPEQHAAVKYLCSFLKPNCIAEIELTIALRNKRTEGLCVTENFSAGQVIVKSGQVIDELALSAFDALEKRTAVAIALPAPVDAPTPTKKYYWLTGLAGGGIVLAIISGIILRRKKSVSRLPALADYAAENENLRPEDWKHRAIAAERRAEKAQKVIREGLVAQLARWMSDTLVQKLLMQRAHLIEAQEKAVTEVDRLGQRLDTIHSRLQGRLSIYEQRIVELEKELDTKDEINRELIQAEIRKIRCQMDAERVKGEGGLN